MSGAISRVDDWELLRAITGWFKKSQMGEGGSKAPIVLMSLN